jgi:hypothetical protein
MPRALLFSENVRTTGRKRVDGTSTVAGELTYGLWLTMVDFPMAAGLEMLDLTDNSQT